MKRVLAVTAVLALLGLGIAAQADVFNLGTGFTNLETVAVGNAGNTGEVSGPGAGGAGSDRICGSVGYTYNIGKYEVTAKQYADFLNAKAQTDAYGLYNTNMAAPSWGCQILRSGSSGSYTYSVSAEWANRPVNYVGYWDALRFANWLGNGQGNGDTETGAYTLDGYTGSDGHTIQRNAGWNWAVTSEDEWYKAAYYKTGGTSAGYWDYPTKSDTQPSNIGSDGYTDPGNHANYYVNGYTLGTPHWRTNVGEFENSASAYGTFDQGGNLWEWNEALPYDGYIYRGLRGGSMYATSSTLQASNRGSCSTPSYELDYMGFRVSQVPEPSSLIALGALVTPLLAFSRRKGK